MATIDDTEHSSSIPAKATRRAAEAYQKQPDAAPSKPGAVATEPDTQRSAHAPKVSITSAKLAARPLAKESLREQKKARAREAILIGATKLISTEGYARTKMRDIALAADMSYQTLYNYFPTKGLILQELLTRDLAKLHRATAHTLTNQEHLNNKLRELAKSYIDAIAPGDRHLWKEVCAELLKVTSPHSSLLALLDEQALQKLRDLFSTAQTKGELDPHIDTTTLAGLVFSLLDATLIRYLVNENLTRPNMLSTISAQLRLTITPYLLGSRKEI